MTRFYVRPAILSVVVDWDELLARETARYEERAGEGDDQQALTRLGNAAWGAGLAVLMLGRGAESVTWLRLAVAHYRESYAQAPPGSWGRPIATMKAGILAGDWDSAAEDASLTLADEAAASDSPIGLYAAALALLVLGRDAEAGEVVARLGGDFPADVAGALGTLAAGDVADYTASVERVLVSFEEREGFLEEMPVADTVLVLQALAERRGIAAKLDSPLLP